MDSSSKSERGTAFLSNPLAGDLPSQPSQSHLKRFIMFDHSGGKGRVFFHPVLAQELFGSSQTPECNFKGFYAEKGLNVKLLAYRQMVEGAFTSLQAIRASRQSGMSFMQQPSAIPLLPGALTSSQNPRVFESIVRDGSTWAVHDQGTAQHRMASKTLVCKEKAKVSAIPPSTESSQDCKNLAPLFSISSHFSGTKSDVAAASEPMRENTEDLDALLSSDEDEDEDVRSTGHSPDESLCKGESFGEDEDEEVEQPPNKRRKVGIKFLNELEPEDAGAGEEVNDHRVIQGNRRQKIKKTVKALRKMLAGGAFLDAALVLDETIMYVKTLRDRVSQLEATRFQSYFCP